MFGRLSIVTRKRERRKKERGREEKAKERKGKQKGREEGEEGGKGKRRRKRKRRYFFIQNLCRLRQTAQGRQCGYGYGSVQR